MKISISNIAWQADEDDATAQVMQRLGIKGVDIAPTRVWEQPLDTPSQDIEAHKAYWNRQGINVIGIQSLLYGRPELKVFGSPEEQQQTIDYLSGMIKVAQQLGAKPLVFGNPRNRTKGDMSFSEALDAAASFFVELAEIAGAHNTIMCLEPNAADYDCDFVQTTSEALELVRMVNHPAFRLHLDAGIMTMNGEDYEEALLSAADWLAHFHVSEPFLKGIGEGGTDHARVARGLREIGYDKWVSIEMRPGLKPDNVESVQTALSYVTEIYG